MTRHETTRALNLHGCHGDITEWNLNALVERCHSVMMDARDRPLSEQPTIARRGDIHWNTCYLGTRVGNAGLVSTGNTRDGQPINLCQQPRQG